MARLIDGTRWEAYRSLAANKDYRRWFWSSLASSLGDWVGIFALQVLVVSLADPGSSVALFGLGGIMLARLLPSVLFGPVAGALADRWDRKRVMVAADALRAGLFAAVLGVTQLWGLFALTFAAECCSLLYLSAKQAALPAVADEGDLAEANQLTLLVTYGPLPFGAAAASAMTALAGLVAATGLPRPDPTTLALGLTAVTFALAALLLVRLRLDDGGKRRGGDGGLLGELRAGLAAIRTHRLVRAVIVGTTGVFLGAGAIVTLGPAFVREDLGRTESDWYGLATTVGLGVLAGIAVAPALGARLGPARVFPFALSGAALAAVAVALAPSYRLVQVVGAILGALVGSAFVSCFTTLHERVDDAVRARTFAAFYTTTRMAMFLALAAAPFLAVGLDGVLPVSGVRAVLLLGGAIASASAVGTAVAMRRALRDG